MGTHAKTGTRRQSPDRLGPLEITIGLMVLSVALVLVLAGRSGASSSADAFGPSARAAVSAPVQDADPAAGSDHASQQAPEVQSMERNVAPSLSALASAAVHLAPMTASDPGDVSDD